MILISLTRRTLGIIVNKFILGTIKFSLGLSRYRIEYFEIQ